MTGLSFIVTGLDEMILEFESLAAVGAPLESIAALELQLHLLFEQTQADCHVITGSLRGSGKTRSELSFRVWVGEIEYGGDAPGFPKSPVEYADYELSRGGEHDFLRACGDWDDAFDEAILTGWH